VCQHSDSLQENTPYFVRFLPVQIKFIKYRFSLIAVIKNQYTVDNKYFRETIKSCKSYFTSQIKRKHSSSLTGSPKDKYAMDNSSKLKKMKNENNKFMF
jgi:hypothetical protein